MRHVFGLQISIHSGQVRDFITDQLAQSARFNEPVQAVEVDIHMDGRRVQMSLEEFQRRVFGSSAQIVSMPMPR